MNIAMVTSILLTLRWQPEYPPKTCQITIDIKGGVTNAMVSVVTVTNNPAPKELLSWRKTYAVIFTDLRQTTKAM